MAEFFHALQNESIKKNHQGGPGIVVEETLPAVTRFRPALSMPPLSATTHSILLMFVNLSSINLPCYVL